MLSKLGNFIKAVVGVAMTLITFLAIAILGVAVFFIGWFLIWGILGVIVIVALGALIYDFFEDR